MTPNELVLTFRGSYVCANFGENRSRNTTVRVLADGQTHRQTHTQTDANRFYNLSHAICYSYGTDNYAVAYQHILLYGQTKIAFIVYSIYMILNSISSADRRTAQNKTTHPLTVLTVIRLNWYTTSIRFSAISRTKQESDRCDGAEPHKQFRFKSAFKTSKASSISSVYRRTL